MKLSSSLQGSEKIDTLIKEIARLELGILQVRRYQEQMAPRQTAPELDAERNTKRLLQALTRQALRSKNVEMLSMLVPRLEVARRELADTTISNRLPCPPLRAGKVNKSAFSSALVQALPSAVDSLSPKPTLSF